MVTSKSYERGMNIVGKKKEKEEKEEKPVDYE